MKVHQNADGGIYVSARDYDIAKDTKIYAGQVVDLKDGLVTAHAVGGTDAILGIAAETHTGTPDPFNLRNDGVKIKVFDAPHQVFRCPAPILEATGGTGTAVTAVLAGAADAYKGGYLKLVEKAEDSENTDAVGTVYRIEAFEEGGTFTKAEGGVPSIGDKYALFMPVGFEGGNLSEDGEKIVVTATAELPLRVIGRIEETNEITIIPVKHLLGANS